MKSRGARGWIGRKRGIALLAAAVALPLCAQPAGAADTVSRRLAISAAAAAGGQLVREIDDPSTGERWLLVRNERDPGGPGRLVLAGTGRNGMDGARERVQSRGQDQEPLALPVIRLGDRLVIEEHTAVIDAVLEARALDTAARGSTLDVRLTIGGKVMRAVALGPGRAELQPESGVWP